MLSNHCPECYSNEGLRLTFKQRFTENAFSKSIVEDLKNEIHCLTCDNPIYSGRWTREIEQVVAYQQRATTPKATSMKIKTLSWVLAAIFILALVFSVLLALDVIKI